MEILAAFLTVTAAAFAGLLLILLVIDSGRVHPRTSAKARHDVNRIKKQIESE